MHKAAKRAHIATRVGKIAEASGLELTVDYNATYGGWRLEEGTDYGGVSTSLFGDRRRTFDDFIDYLSGIQKGITLMKVNA